MTDNDNIWADKFIKRESISAGELAQRFNINNPRQHPEAQRAATESSLDTVGWIDEVSLSTNGDGPPSLADNPDAVMFDGHERVEIALVRGGPDMLVPVNWYQLTPEETDFALLAKDQTSAMAQIDPVKMADLMERTKAMTTAPGLQGMMERLKEQVADGLLAQNGNGAGTDTAPQIDKAAELQEKWQVQPGQLWELGEHRVICGDCTDAAVVERVMGGERADMCFTSPMYNAGNSKTGAYHGGNAHRTDFKKMYINELDDMSKADYETFLLSVLRTIEIISKQDSPILWNVSYNQNNRNSYGRICFNDANPFEVQETIIWDKGLGMNIAGKHILSRTCEFVFLMSKTDKYYSNQNGGVYWNVWRISNKDGENMSLHGASFPIKLPTQGILQFSPDNAIIIDPFLGSGTTLIACQNLNRRCRGIEIEPKYVAITLQRFLDHTGIQPRLLETVEA